MRPVGTSHLSLAVLRGAAALAVALQVHTTLPIGQVGLRISVADLLLPFAAALGLVAVVQRRTAPLTGVFRWLALLLAVASLWLVVAIIHGRIELGYWQNWAVVNRGLGFLVTLAFFAVGWVVAQAGPPDGDRLIARSYLVFFWLSCIVSAVVMVLLSANWFGLAPVAEPKATPLEHTLGFVTGPSRFQGFVVNPNAFGLLAAVATLIQIAYAPSRPLFSPLVGALGLGVSLFGLVCSFSRGAWLGTAVAMTFLCFARRSIFRPLLIGGAVAAVASLVFFATMPTPPRPAESQLVQDLLVFRGSLPSIDHRRTVALRSLELWGESPIEGAGVGVFLGRQTPTPEDPLATIHSTYLWLLAETGIVGFSAFGLVFVVAFVALTRAQQTNSAGGFLTGVAAIMIAFATAALAMDVMYQRPLWLLLGLGLGFAARHPPHSATG